MYGIIKAQVSIQGDYKPEFYAGIYYRFMVCKTSVKIKHTKHIDIATNCYMILL